MPLSKKFISKILKDYKEVFDSLARYDETREWLIGRKRIDITLDKRIIKKLRERSEKTGQPVSRIIEDSVVNV